MAKSSFALSPAKIKVIGLGGGGCNAVTRMVQEEIQGVEFIAMNTDAQAMALTEAPVRIQLGERLTRGLGVGGDHGVGQKAAEENITTLQKKIEEYQVRLPSWNAEKTKLDEAIKTIKDELASLDDRIKVLNDETRVHKKQTDEQIRKLEKEKKHIIIKINDIQKLNSIIFENIGNIAYHNRIEDEKLKDIYAQIDITEKKIRNLEAR